MKQVQGWLYEDPIMFVSTDEECSEDVFVKRWNNLKAWIAFSDENVEKGFQVKHNKSMSERLNGQLKRMTKTAKARGFDIWKQQ